MRKKDIMGKGWLSNKFVINSSMKKVNDEEAYSALINFLPGSREIKDEVSGENRFVSGDGFKWLVYHPINEFWVFTAIYDSKGNVLQWYFDINKSNFIDENGIPCRDDLYLDLVILPDGRVITKDVDELQEALDTSAITEDDYHHAFKVREQILNSKWCNIDVLRSFSDILLSDYQ